MDGKRRTDRVLDPGLPDRISDLDTEGVRSLRDDCRSEEARLSYVRRLLHGRIDIARAEAERRGGDAEGLLARLPQILAEHGASSGQARSLRVYTPGTDDPERRVEDQVAEDPAFSRLPELDDDGLESLVGRLGEAEREVSRQRKTVIEHLELLQGELVARYRDGRASIDEILTPNPSQSPEA